jgi:hypothetical protein
MRRRESIDETRNTPSKRITSSNWCSLDLKDKSTKADQRLQKLTDERALHTVYVKHHPLSSTEHGILHTSAEARKEVAR